MSIDFAGGMGIASSIVQTWLNMKAGEEQQIATLEMENQLVQEEDAVFILASYDIAKSNVIYMESMLIREITTASADIDLLLGWLQNVREQKEKLKTERTKYLSFTVISPYLWEACRQIFLADSDYLALKGRDKEALDKAVIFLAKSCHKEWLYQADESVRQQFVEVQRELKNVATQTELEDYKIVTTLLDSMDSSKPRGAECWWTKK